MPAFNAPALFTEIDTDLYRSQLDSNFRKIQESFQKLSTVVTALNGSAGVGQPGNLKWIDTNLKPDGPIGIDSWVPTFSVDTDGDFTVSLSHNTPSGYSFSIILGVLHYSNASISLDIQEPNVDIDSGSWRYVIGLKTLGAPAVQAVCEQADGDTDSPGTCDVELWEFMLYRETDGDRIANLKRVARPLLDADLFSLVEQQVVPMGAYVATLPTSPGDTGAGFIVPFACDVYGAKAFLRAWPGVGEEVEVDLLRQRWSLTGAGTVIAGDGDNISVLDSTFRFTLDETDLDGASIGSTMEVLNAEPFQLSEGDFVNIKLLSADSGATAADLTVQLLVRPLRHEVLSL